MHNSIDPALARAASRFTEWREQRKLGTRIPEQLWELAAKLATTHGLVRTSKVLGLDYHGLKKRTSLLESHGDSTPEFIELKSTEPPQSGECIIEFEDATGCCMRVHLKGYEAPDLRALGRSFWNND